MPLRAAIIGTGRIGSSLERDPLRATPHTHAGWYAAHPDVALVAGADIDAAARDAFADHWRGAGVRTYEHYHELLERERPDLVSVCGYAPDRLSMARAAIDVGARGLWLEKAVACSPSEADTLIGLARAAGVVVVVNHPRRQDGRYREVRRLIETRELGRLESVHAVFSGNLIHTGTHAWDVLDTWLGAWDEVRCWPQPSEDAGVRLRTEQGPSSATGWARQDAKGQAGDMSGTATIRFADGTQAFVSACRKDYFIFQFDLFFRGGRVRLGNEVARVFRTVPSGRYEGFIELADEGAALDGPGGPPIVNLLVERVRARMPDLSMLEEASRALDLGVALIQAAATPGAAVTPDAVNRDFYVASV